MALTTPARSAAPCRLVRHPTSRRNPRNVRRAVLDFVHNFLQDGGAPDVVEIHAENMKGNVADLWPTVYNKKLYMRPAPRLPV